MIKEYKPDLFASWFRLSDGHLPEYQPRACEEDALKWLDKNVYQRISFILDTLVSKSKESTSLRYSFILSIV